VLFRYGGEEFVAVLPAAAADDLLVLGERLRRAIMESAVTDGEQTVRVTVSIGGVAYPRDGVESDEGLIRLVDEALYRAKESGRNRTEVSK